MSIQKYQDSFSGLPSSSFSSMLDRFFSDSLSSQSRVNSFSPHVDAYETENSYELEAALPGMKREDIKVDFHQGRLSISGERHFRTEQAQRRYHLVESAYGSFHRSFQLPDTVDAKRIEAAFEDGMLRVSVPKDQQKSVRHQIEIRGSQGNTSSTQKPERLNQQSSGVPIQPSNGTSAPRAGKSTSKSAMEEMNSRPKSSGVGS